VADVFISYSRHDQAFVRRLADQLGARGKEAWVDWKDIAPTVEWRREIVAGVEAADAFAFVISPASLQSRECGEELAAALERKKRIVPLVLADPNGVPVPEALESRNWIFFRDSDDFDGALDTLVSALDADIDWVRAHTRLLMRASEWDAHGRDRSYLLSGSDLREAEDWLAVRSAGKKPEATDLQREYVLASRRAASRRQRIAFGGVAVALLVAVVLAIVALVQRGQAVSNERTAKSRALAALSRFELATNPQISLGLAVSAYGIKHSDQAAASLRGAAFQDELRATLIPSGHAPSNGGALSPDGTHVATGADQTLVWNLRSHRARALHGTSGLVYAVAYSRDGRRLVAGDKSGDVVVWDLSTGAAPQVLHAGRGAVNRVAFSPDGKWVAGAYDDGHVRAWDLGRPGAPEVMPGHATTNFGVAFSPDGRWLAGSGDGEVVVWDLRHGNRARTLWTTDRAAVTELAFGGPNDTLAAVDADKLVRLWDLRGAHGPRVLHGSIAPLNTVAVSPQGDRVTAGADDGTLLVWDLRAQVAPRVLRGNDAPVLWVAFGPDGHRLVSDADDVRVWDLGGGGRQRLLPPASSSVSEVAYGGGEVLALDDSGRLEAWNQGGGTPPQSVGDSLNSFAVTPDGRQIAAFLDDGDVDVGAVEGTAPPRLVLQDENNVNRAAFSRDGRELAAAHDDGSVFVWDLAAGGRRRELAGEGTASNQAIAFSPDGVHLAVGDIQGRLRQWNLRAGGRPQTRVTTQSLVAAAAYSPDGREIATSGEDGTVHVWSSRGLRQLAVLTGIPGVLSGVSFSHDGHWVIASGVDGSVREWAWREVGARDNPITLLSLGAATPINDIALAPDSDQIAAASKDGAVRLVSCTVCRPLAAVAREARTRLGSVLTPGERRFVSEETKTAG
jgi:WD40 repeat protein